MYINFCNYEWTNCAIYPTHKCCMLENHSGPCRCYCGEAKDKED